MIKFRKKLLLAKLEAVAGNPQNLAAADAVLAGNIELTPLAGDTVSRELERPYYAANEVIHVNPHHTLAFRVELAGSGAAATPPAWGRLLRACGFAETITANTRVDYTPVSAGESTITLGLNIDGQLHTLHGARGTFNLEAGANQIPYLNFTFTGRYNAPVARAQVANPDYSGFKAPLVGSNANTPTFSLFGTALDVSAYSYEHGNEVVHRELIGASPDVIITNRAPSFQVTLDHPGYGALNLITKTKDGDTGALQINHGVGAGKIIEVAAPKVQISAAPTLSEADGAAQYQLTLAALPSNAAAGNDEIKITTK